MQTQPYRTEDKNAAVRNIQYALYILAEADEADAGLRVAIDGFYGEETASAVAGFQTRRGLKVTGETDYETFTLMMKERDAILAGSENEILPLKPSAIGDKSESVAHLNRLLSFLAEDYAMPDPIPDGDLYTRETEAGVAHMRSCFFMEGDGADAAFIGRLLMEAEARAAFRKFS